MKKTILLFAAAAVVLTTAVSCGKGSPSGEDNDSTALAGKVDPSDTMAVNYGKMTGNFVGRELGQYAEQTGKGYDTDEFVAGVEYILNSNRSEAFLAGMNTGLRMAAELNQFANAGFDLSRATVAANFKVTVTTPLSETEEAEVNRRFSEFADKVSSIAEKKAEAEKSATPEAIQNIKTGEALVAKAIKDEPAAVTTPSGLVYIIRQEGEGEKIRPNDDVEVKYVGSHLDGKVFDQNTTTFKPSQTVPGFNEGLTLLKKGSKARLYIPGKLGYGANGAPGAGIGPMETLVFDVEILDVTPEN
ncbi:MAG: FKBP-type peptidyl-prolyl cis-trans isomerase [Muribaculaceae bacterium]|nr:FKBP-type peptidyl-prolyl cis-trans isomerase [Muribaculaceae bacterium]